MQSVQARWQSHVHPHGEIRQLAPSLWQVTGSLRRNPLPRNMTLIRLTSGELVVHSAVALDDTGMGRLESLGRPSILIVPNGMHRMDAAVYRERYPSIQVLCPRAVASRVEQVVPVTGACEDVLPALGIRCHVPDGLKPGELVFEADSGAGRALIVTDALFNLKPLSGFAGWLTGVLGSTGFFGMTRVGRLLMVSDRAAFKRWLEAVAGLPDLRIVTVAHGEPLTADCAARLREAAARL